MLIGQYLVPQGFIPVLGAEDLGEADPEQLVWRVRLQAGQQLLLAVAVYPFV